MCARASSGKRLCIKAQNAASMAEPRSLRAVLRSRASSLRCRSAVPDVPAAPDVPAVPAELLPPTDFLLSATALPPALCRHARRRREPDLEDVIFELRPERGSIDQRARQHEITPPFTQVDDQ